MSNNDIQKLTLSYQKSFIDKASGFQHYVDAINLDNEQLNEIFLKAHKLAGSATSYGFPDITECAASLAMMVKNKTYSDHDEIQSKLRLLIKALRAY